MSLSIAYFINSYPAISHTFIRREIDSLERQGFDVFRVALRGWENELADDVDQEERARTRYVLRDGPISLAAAVLRTMITAPGRFLQALVLALRMSWKATRPLPYHLVYLAEACRVLQWLRAQDVAHVHAHFGTNSAEVVMLARALGGPPYSFTVHGPLEFDSPAHLGLGEKIRRSAFVVAITSYTRSQLCRCSNREDWSKIQVVRSVLHPEIFEAEAVRPAPEPRLVCVGRLVEQKGQMLLIDAAARLAAEGVDFHLVLAGGGPLREGLEALIRQHDLGDNITLLGAVGTERIYKELRLARGLVLPSFAEGLPMVIMEAMALRRPVISTYIAGIPELVRDGEHGWLIPAGSVDHLVAAMKDLLSRPVDELEAMGEAAFERVRERHSSDTETPKLARLFRESARAHTAEPLSCLKAKA